MVAKFLYLNNLSLQRQPFELLNDERKVRATPLFPSAIVHGIESHACQIFRFFFSVIFSGPRFVEIHTFCYHGNVM